MLSSVAVAAAAYQGIDFTYIHSHFLQLAVAAFIISTLLSVYLYVRSLYAAPAELALGGSSGKTWLTLSSESTASNPPCMESFVETCGLIFVQHLIDHMSTLSLV